MGGWNLLSKLVDGGAVKTEEFLTYEAGRYAQEKLIKNKSPLWTALVRDHRSSHATRGA